MNNIGISTAADLEAFFQAFNKRDYDALFEKYMAEDCLWHASERVLKGKREILDYWTKSHSAFEGDICQFGCADYYELDSAGRIRLGLVYLRFFD